MTQRFFIPAVAFLLGAACASTNTQPAPQLESSSAAIRAAEEVGASHNPTAALHLQLAKEQFEHAGKLSSKEDKPRADRLLMRAEADAELALALARSEDEKAEARGAIDKAKKLKEAAAVQANQ
jgi:hypothetical protein